MPLTRLVAVAFLVVVAGATAAGPDPSVHSYAGMVVTRCRAGSVPAIIEGERACFRAGQRCANRLERQYNRYGFRCRAGRLQKDAWIALESRPLHLPTLAPGNACPRSPGQVNSEFGTLYGPGPAYAALFQLRSDGIVHYGASTPEGGWYSAKVLWVIDPDHRERTLVRGRQLDGPNTLRFGFGPTPPRVLRISRWGSTNGSRWGHNPSETRSRARGCYAYQADGADFSTVVVFEAAP
jgi:hypothetical protein